MEMTQRRRFLSLGLAAAFAVVGGTAWAVVRDDVAGPGRPATLPAPTSGTLAEGAAPSGGRYAISRIDPERFGVDPAKWLCAEIVTPASAAQGCSPVPGADGWFDGKPLRASYALLGTDRFFSLVAPQGVTAMEVRIAGTSEATAARPIDAGPAGRLLVAAVGGPRVTSRDPASSRDYELRLLGPDGETVTTFAASDPGD